MRYDVLMYICICNCLKEQHCRASLEMGATCALEVYEKQGCKPKCGKCVPYVEQNFFAGNIAFTQASATN
jgi:bacterioferritin-associated ferredoxin